MVMGPSVDANVDTNAVDGFDWGFVFVVVVVLEEGAVHLVEFDSVPCHAIAVVVVVVVVEDLDEKDLILVFLD